MASVKISIVILLLCASNNFIPISSTEIVHKIVGLVKTEAEILQNKIQDVAHSVSDLFHPHHHRYPGQPGGYSPFHPGPHSPGDRHYPPGHPSYQPGSSNQHFPTGPHHGFPMGHGRPHPDFSTGEGSFTPDRSTGPGYQNPVGSNYPNGGTGAGYSNSNGYYPDRTNGGYSTNQGGYAPDRSTSHGNPNFNTPTGQGSNSPGQENINRGQGSFNPLGNEGSYSGSSTWYPSVNLDPTPEPIDTDPVYPNNKPKYDVDIRNSEGGMVNNTTPSSNDPSFRSLLAFKGCPDGQRKDHAGKCRAVN